MVVGGRLEVVDVVVGAGVIALVAGLGVVVIVVK